MRNRASVWTPPSFLKAGRPNQMTCVFLLHHNGVIILLTVITMEVWFWSLGTFSTSFSVPWVVILSITTKPWFACTFEPLWRFLWTKWPLRTAWHGTVRYLQLKLTKIYFFGYWMLNKTTRFWRVWTRLAVDEIRSSILLTSVYIFISCSSTSVVKPHPWFVFQLVEWWNRRGSWFESYPDHFIFTT